ncbi:hypothetical protein ACOME3_007273 [Neoechinorhynchus agilis]
MQYARQVLANSRQLVKSMQEFGYEFATGGTDNHMSLLKIDRSTGLDGAKVTYLLEQVSISVNKNAIPGDKSVLKPSGVRFGTPAITTRGLKEDDMVVVARFLHHAIGLALNIERTSQTLNDRDSHASASFQVFKKTCDDLLHKEISELKQEIINFASHYAMPGC